MRALTRSVLLSLTSLGLCLAVTAGARAQAKATANERIGSGIDIYGGYGLYQPLNSMIAGFQYHQISNPNVTASVAKYFTNNLGAQVEGSYFTGNNNLNNEYGSCAVTLCNQRIYTAQAGPIYRIPVGRFVPFAHVLAGGTKINGPAFQPLTWGFGATVGAGVDYVLPLWHNRFAIRPAQVDYQYTHVNYGTLGQASPTAPANSIGGTAGINAVKLSAGLVLHLSEADSTVTPLIYGCSASPIDVYPGEPVTVTGSTVGLKSKKVPNYTWAAKGGTLTSTANVATIDTTGLEAGQYDVIGRISTGTRPGEQSYCSAPFNVKAYTAPTIACTASTNSTLAGEMVEIDCTARSEQNLPLTYKFTTTAGQLDIHENVAKLSTAGLPPGNITVTGTVKDNKGKSASTTVLVVITAPPAPKVEVVQPTALCTISYARDVKRPARVDNEAKGCLDDIALTLGRSADAKLVIVGNSSPLEKPEIAAERALNERQYLTTEKGIDPARISVRVGETSGQTVKNYLVPAGATFAEPNTQRFDETRIKRHGQAYGVPRKPSDKKPVKKAAKKAVAKPTAPPAAK
jgi:hypothetical protein